VFAKGELPTIAEVREYVRGHRNWGRWGQDDQLGAINLITPDKRKQAACLVRQGISISLSRDFPTAPSARNPQPAQHYVWANAKNGEAGSASDYIGSVCHGFQTTHIDALCHMWGEDGMWGGRHGLQEVSAGKAAFGGLEHWRDGIVTRGVLLDVARRRGKACVTLDQPVHGWELEEIENAQGTRVEPGDAIFIYSGKEAFEEANQTWSPHGNPSPGISVSCLPFFRERDISVLGWDMFDVQPPEIDWAYTPHTAIHAFGIALIDNCDLRAVRAACASADRFDFMVTIGPLALVGGTGSPVNPIAIL
jgi:kynurenine formamidase